MRWKFWATKADADPSGRPGSIDELLRHGGGGETWSGAIVTPRTALMNSVVWRCVDLISGSLAMLPWALERVEPGGRRVEDLAHPLSALLARPNGWQTDYEFRRLLQYWVLTRDGGAVAYLVRSRGVVTGLWPVHPDRVTCEQLDDMSLRYTISRKDGSRLVCGSEDVLHLRALSTDGVDSLAPANQARQAIGLAVQAEKAAARLFRNGVMVGGILSAKNKLSKESREDLKLQLETLYSGADNANKWLVTDGDMTAAQRGASASDNQHAEARAMQVEEILRFFGVPRPLAMVDETSWGSGVEQLATLFVRFGLSQWFTAWEQALARSCLRPEERRRYRIAIDENYLLRGTIKDQADYFAKALGSGGSAGWLTPNEVREQGGWGTRPDGDALPQQAAQKQGVTTP